MKISIIALVLRELFTEIQPFVVVFNASLGLVIGGLTLYLLLRTRPRKGKTILPQPGAVIVNWSGHPLPSAGWTTPFKVWNPKDAPVFKVDSWEDIQRSVREMLRHLPKDLQLRMLRADSSVIIVVPQLAAGLCVLLATLHGQTGVFPTVTCPLRKEDGTFWLPQPISLGQVRLKSREDRDLSVEQ